MRRFWILTLALCLFLLSGCASKAPSSDGTMPQFPDKVEEVADSAPILDGEFGDTTHGEFSGKPAGDVVEIPEKVFIAQINDIYLHPDDYLGKIIQYEGIYQSEIWPLSDGDEEIHYVIRYGPGCCGSDGNAGFEIAWAGEYPNLNDWVEVSGVLTKVQVDEYGYYLQLICDTLSIKEERGAEYVLQ